MIALGRSRNGARRAVALAGKLAALAALASGGCGPQLDVGSDVLWSSGFEGNSFDEWTGVAGGAVGAEPATNSVLVSAERPHGGRYAAKLTIDGIADGSRHSASLRRAGGLPTEAYYSAWYYLPRSVGVGVFWVIAKFRMRAVADDPASEGELYDLNLATLPSGEMTLRLYDHRSGDVPLEVSEPVVPVGRWFQVEAFYRNTPDATGRVTYWLDGRRIVDIAGRAMSPTPWIEWLVCSIGEDLTPVSAVIYVDDIAVSRARVGPDGLLRAP